MQVVELVTFLFPMVPLCSKSFLIKFYQNWKRAIDVVFALISFSFELFK